MWVLGWRISMGSVDTGRKKVKLLRKVTSVREFYSLTPCDGALDFPSIMWILQIPNAASFRVRHQSLSISILCEIRLLIAYISLRGDEGWVGFLKGLPAGILRHIILAVDIDVVLGYRENESMISGRYVEMKELLLLCQEVGIPLVIHLRCHTYHGVSPSP